MSIIERVRWGPIEGVRVGRLPWTINTTCILFRFADILVDTGPPNQWDYVRRFLLEANITRIVITHYHEDHSGNLANALRSSRAGCEVPLGSEVLLRRGFPLRLYQRIVWGKPKTVSVSPLVEGPVISFEQSLIPILTPGHSFDSTCYYHPNEGILFSGDLLISRTPQYLRSDEDVALSMKSLRKVCQLDFQVVCCAHSGVHEDGKDRLLKKLDYLENLSGQACYLFGQGKSLKEIVLLLLGREGLLKLLTMGHFSKRNLIIGCLRAGGYYPEASGSV